MGASIGGGGKGSTGDGGGGDICIGVCVFSKSGVVDVGSTVAGLEAAEEVEEDAELLLTGTGESVMLLSMVVLDEEEIAEGLLLC